MARSLVVQGARCPLRDIPAEQVIPVGVDAGKANGVALIAAFTGEWVCAPFSF